MPHAERRATWAELRRVGRRVVALDYAVPLPRNPADQLCRAIEAMAGGEHHAGFRDFPRRGGLASLLDAPVRARQRTSSGCMELVVV